MLGLCLAKMSISLLTRFFTIVLPCTSVHCQNDLKHYTVLVRLPRSADIHKMVVIGEQFIAWTESSVDDHQHINTEESETAFVETVVSNESLVVVGVEEMELEILR